jgi:hypothetical protein
VDAEIQASNAPDGLKTQSAAVLASTNALCEAIEEFKNSLNE